MPAHRSLNKIHPRSYIRNTTHSGLIPDSFPRFTVMLSRTSHNQLEGVPHNTFINQINRRYKYINELQRNTSPQRYTAHSGSYFNDSHPQGSTPRFPTVKGSTYCDRHLIVIGFSHRDRFITRSFFFYSSARRGSIKYRRYNQASTVQIQSVSAQWNRIL